ncbi:MAG: dipicolinate synthase subunit DpsA [Bacillota bacterium]|jgi:dipicolinate synthase subunit A
MNSPDLSGCRIAVLGGDARSLFYIPALMSAGATVKAVGMEKAVRLIPCQLSSLQDALLWANVLVLPMGGIAEDGTVSAQYSDSRLALTMENGSLVRSGCLVLTGVARNRLRQMAGRLNWRLVEIIDDDQLAILNSVPSAEGALQMAMEASDITIHHSSSFVLGYGRVGTTLANALSGLSARVTVVARKPVDLARIQSFGHRAVPFAELAHHIHQADFIYNTVPALVLGESLLQETAPEVVIIDIASSPGGVDYAAAERLGRKAILAPSLPGRVAPRTAGRILGELLPKIIKEHFERRIEWS